MNAVIRCASCGVIFAPFAGDDHTVAAFRSHPCCVEISRRRHPSTWTPPSDGAA